MRKLILKMSLSADGFVGGPQGEIDWLFQGMDPAAVAWTVATIGEAGLHLMGSRTFRDMAAYWPTSTEPFAPAMNEIPKAVFSRRGLAGSGTESTTTALRDARARQDPAGVSAAPAAAIAASWAEPLVARGDLAEEIGRLKGLPGRDLLAHGGASFARSLVRQGLVDEYRLLVHPVVLGRGLPLFSELPKPVHLELRGSTVFPGGAVAQVYWPRA